MLVNGKLYLGKWHQMQPYGTGVPGNESGKIYYLIPCPFAGVWIAVKVYGGKLKAALCHEVARNGAVYASGYEQRGAAGGAGRHAVCAGYLLAVKIRLFAYFDTHLYLWGMNVYAEAGKALKQHVAQLPVDLLAVH